MSVLIRSNSNYELNAERLADIILKLKLKLKDRAQEVYVFGSAATGDFNKDSDIDLIIIQKSNKSFFERQKDFFDIYDIYPNMDLLVYTPEEFQNQLADSHIGFWKSVRESMQRIL